MRLPLRRIFLLVFLACLGASFVPGLPLHGYGHVWFGLPLLYWFREPAQRRRMLLYALGLGLQVLAYPDPDWGFLGWVLLLPYLLARREPDGAHPWRSAFLYGFLRAHVGFFWLGDIHFLAWFSVSLVTALLFPLVFEGGIRVLRSVPYALRVGTSWVAFEWCHGWFFGGFPWLYLSHTQYAYPVAIQAADVVGAFGVSFVMAYVQAAALRRAWGERAVALGLFAALLGYGLVREGPGEGPAPRVLLVQTDYSHSLKMQGDLTLEVLYEKLYSLTMEGLLDHPDVDLVVWPETMHPVPYIEGDPTDPSGFHESLRLLAGDFRRPAVYGINSYTSVEKSERYRGFNAACVADAEGRLLGVYRKQRLVPMGEEFLARLFLPESLCDAIMRKLVSWLSYPETCDLEAGRGFTILDAGPGLRCAPLICFEGLYPDLARAALRSGQADLILHLMNNGWFGPFEPRQAVASWVFRAVETRTPFVSCANVGQSCIIAPSGRIVARLEPVPAEGCLAGPVPRRWPEPPWLHGGYLLLPALLAGAVLFFLLRGLFSARRAPSRGLIRGSRGPS